MIGKQFMVHLSEVDSIFLLRIQVSSKLVERDGRCALLPGFFLCVKSDISFYNPDTEIFTLEWAKVPLDIKNLLAPVLAYFQAGPEAADDPVVIPKKNL